MNPEKKLFNILKFTYTEPGRDFFEIVKVNVDTGEILSSYTSPRKVISSPVMQINSSKALMIIKED